MELQGTFMGAAAKYRTIYNTLIREVGEGVFAVGCCLPTENELAARFGVSRQTVLKALDLLKAEGVLSGIRGRGTFVVRAASRPGEPRGGRQLAFVCIDIQDSFGHEVFLGFEAEAARSGYTVAVGNSSYDALREAEHLKRLHAQGVAGIALVPFLAANRKLVLDLHGAGWPVVCIDNHYGIDGVPCIVTDNRRAAYGATLRLIRAGRSRIGFLTNTFDALETSFPVRERFEGYRQALSEGGLEFRRELVQELGPALTASRPTDVGLDIFGYQAMHKLLMSPERPDAVLLLWDELAPGALNAIRNSRLNVPEDIALVGFNDDSFCTLLTPPLTTIRQPARRMGELAARQLIELAGGGAVPPETVLQNQLIRRGSTDAAF